MASFLVRVIWAALIMALTLGSTGEGNLASAASQFFETRYAPDKVSSNPDHTTLYPGQEIDFTITASSRDLPPFLTLELDKGLEIVGEAACGVDLLAYPYGSGPERSRMVFLDCTGGWWTDLTSGITTMEAGVPNPGMNPVTHSILINMTVRVSSFATPGTSLHITANEGLTRKSIAVVTVKNVSRSSTRPTPSAQRERLEPVKALSNYPFVDESIEAAPGSLIRFDIEPQMNHEGGVVHLDLSLPAGLELIGEPSCESASAYACAGKTNIKAQDNGGTKIHWRLSGQMNDSVNITVAVRIPSSNFSDADLTVVAHVTPGNTSNSSTDETKSELIISVVDEK